MGRRVPQDCLAAGDYVPVRRFHTLPATPHGRKPHARRSTESWGLLPGSGESAPQIWLPGGHSASQAWADGPLVSDREPAEVSGISRP